MNMEINPSEYKVSKEEDTKNNINMRYQFFIT